MNFRLAVIMIALATVCLLAIGQADNITQAGSGSSRLSETSVSEGPEKSGDLNESDAVSAQDIQALVEKGRDFAHRGNYRDSIRAFDRVAGLDPKNASIRIAKGKALSEDLARYNESILAYEAAIQIDPKSADAWTGKGDALDSLGRHGDAVAAYDMAIDLDPGSGGAWRGKGDAMRNSGDYEGSLRAYDRAIRADPLDVRAWKGKSIALQALGRASGAYDARVEAKELGVSI
jgi:tetratricopeptide (TPR) repeat protein